MSSAIETKDHAKIRQWAEKHKGSPALVKTSKNKEEGILRIKFDEDSENLQEVSWEEFFDIFDEHDLTFLYQDEKNSRFNKFVSEEKEGAHAHKSR